MARPITLLFAALLLILTGCRSSGPAQEPQSYQDSGMGFAYGKYGLRVPGAVYETQVTQDQSKLTVSSGTKTASTLQINADGTYVWDSAWDGKVIKGTWEKTNDSAYPVVLRKGQEGKDWHLGKGQNSELLLYDGSYMSYEGDRTK